MEHFKELYKMHFNPEEEFKTDHLSNEEEIETYHQARDKRQNAVVRTMAREARRRLQIRTGVSVEILKGERCSISFAGDEGTDPPFTCTRNI